MIIIIIIYYFLIIIIIFMLNKIRPCKIDFCGIKKQKIG